MPRKMRRRPKEKLVISFDEAARTEYLTGFRKRKQERRKHAKRAREVLTANERKRERDERRQSLRELIDERIDDELANEQKIARKRARNGTATVSTTTSTSTTTREIRNEFVERAFGEDSVALVTTTVGLAPTSEKNAPSASMKKKSPKPKREKRRRTSLGS